MYPYTGGLGIVATDKVPSDWIPSYWSIGTCPNGYVKLAAGTKSERCVPASDIMYADVPAIPSEFKPVTPGATPSIIPVTQPTLPTWESLDLVPTTAEGAAAGAPAFNVKALLPIAAIAAALWLM